MLALNRGFRLTTVVQWIVIMSMMVYGSCAQAGDDYLMTMDAVGWSANTRNVRGNAQWVSDVTNTAARSLKIEALGQNVLPNAQVQWLSDWVTAPPAGTVLEVSAVVKGEDIVRGELNWHQLRLAMNFEDENGNNLLHQDLLSVAGTFGWNEFNRLVVVREGAARLRMSFQLTGSTGTAWLDHVTVKVRRVGKSTAEVLDSAKIPEGPVILPQPWKVVYGNGGISLTDVSIDADDVSTAVYAHAQQFARNIGAAIKQEPGVTGMTRIRLAIGSQEAEELIAKAFPGMTMDDLGPQGYFLSIKEGENGNLVLISGETEEAVFYGFQTLRQVVDNTGNTPWLRIVDIVDKPEASRRGINGGVQWFAEWPTALERMASLKLNYIYGLNLNPKFNAQWRIPLTDSEKQNLSDFLKQAQHNYVDITVAIRPREGDPHIRYSSSEDVRVIVDKFCELYEIGFRRFAISFNDMGNWGQDALEYREDMEKFANIGEAHYYFVQRVYEELTKRHPDIELLFDSLQYNRAGHAVGAAKQYLETIGKLPEEIVFLTCPESEDDVDAFSSLTGRKPLLWYNYFAFWEYAYTYVQADYPVFLPPFEGGLQKYGSDESITGHIFLAVIPKNEDIRGTSWFTATDYLWAPGRYNPDDSYGLALAKAVGGADNLVYLRKYMQHLTALEQKLGGQMDDQEANTNMMLLNAYADQLYNRLPPEFYKYFSGLLYEPYTKLLQMSH